MASGRALGMVWQRMDPGQPRQKALELWTGPVTGIMGVIDGLRVRCCDGPAPVLSRPTVEHEGAPTS